MSYIADEVRVIIPQCYTADAADPELRAGSLLGLLRILSGRLGFMLSFYAWVGTRGYPGLTSFVSNALFWRPPRA